MKKITTCLSLFILLLALGACGGDNATGPDPDPDPNPDPPAADYETLDIAVSLPEGSAVDLSQTTMMSLSVESEVTATGQAKMAYNTGTTQLGYLFDADDNLLMAGFVNEDQPEINIQTTTEVLFYIGLGTIFQPAVIREKFITDVRTIPGFDAFAADMEQLFLTNPRMFQEGDYAQPLKAKIEELRQRDTIDIPTTQLDVNGADIRSGLQLADVDFEHFTITNNYRRRAHAYIYKTAFKDKEGNETVLKSEIARGTAADKDTEISPTGAIREFLGVVADWAAGKGADFAATTTDPIELRLEENESEATFKVRIVGPGPGNINDFQTMTKAEESKYTRLTLETFAIDFFLPLILDLGGHDGLENKLNAKELSRLADLVEPVLASTPAAYDKLKEGKFKEALDAFMTSLYNNNAGSNMERMLNDVFAELGKSVKSDLFVQNEKIIGETVEKFVKVVKAVDIGLKAIDYGRLIYDLNHSKRLEEWTAKAKSSDVTLTPKEQVAIPFARKELQVITKTELSDGAVFQYEWSTSGKYGTLSDNRGHSGTSFTSSSEKVTYRSEMQSDQLSDGENIDEIYVTVFIKKPGEEGEKLTKVNTDTARINVQSFRWEIEPDGITIEGGTNVKLHLERVDGFSDIGTSDVFDYKVIWTTGAAYGMLEGSQTTVTKYNSDFITYEALDEEVKNGNENLTARIYFRSKGKSEWNLLDEAEGRLTISNDPDKRYFIVPIGVHSKPPADDDGNGWISYFVKTAFKFTPLTGSDIPAGFEVESTRMVIKERFTGKRSTCIGDSRTFIPGQEDGRYFIDGQYMIFCGGTSGSGHVSNDGYLERAQERYAELLAIYERFEGYAQVIVTFKAKE